MKKPAGKGGSDREKRGGDRQPAGEWITHTRTEICSERTVRTLAVTEFMGLLYEPIG